MRKLIFMIVSALSIFAGTITTHQASLNASAETEDIMPLSASAETVFLAYYGQYTFGNGVISNANISSDISFYCDGVHYKGLKNVFGSTNYTLYFVKEDNTNLKVYDCVINTSKGTWVDTKYKTIYSVSEGTPTNMQYFAMTRTVPTLDATYSGNKVSWTAVPYAAKYYVYNNAGTKVAETTSNSATVNTCGTYYVTAISSSSRQIVQSVDRTLSHSYTKQAIKGRGENIVSGDIHVCTDNVIAYYLCKNCDAIGSDTFVYREAGAHTYGAWQTVTSATCANTGSKKRECTECGDVETESIPATGVHSYGSWVTDKAETCSVAGSKKRTCTVCGKSETQVIPATGVHSYGSWVTDKAETCSVAGSKKRTCTVCGKSETQVIPATGVHSYGSWVTDKVATCSVAGSKKRTCTVCGKSETQAIPATGHNYGNWITDTEPSCLTNGSKHRVCSLCSGIETETIHSFGQHDFTLKANTLSDIVSGDIHDCSNPIIMGYRCSRCDLMSDTHTYVYREAGVHSPKKFYYAPTCTANGYSGESCENCSVTLEQFTLPPLGHDYVDHVCTRCGDVVQGVIVSFHDYDLSVIFMDSCGVGETINLPSKPTRKGYEFIGWYYYNADGEYVKFDQFTRVYADTDIYANYDASYITIYMTDSVTQKTEPVKILKDHSLAEAYKLPTHRGYRFTGYTRDGANVKWSEKTLITETVYLTAHFEITFLGQIINFLQNLSIWALVIVAVIIIVIIALYVNNNKNGKKRRRKRR